MKIKLFKSIKNKVTNDIKKEEVKEVNDWDFIDKVIYINLENRKTDVLK